MTGFTGGTVGATELAGMAEALYREDWYDTRRVVDGGGALALVEHGNRDADANLLYGGDGTLGVVYGVISNADRLGATRAELFRALLDRPDETLRHLEGPFALAAVDARTGRVTLATDKAGSRPVYYTTGDGCQFATELTPLLGHTADPALDPDAVSDLLLMGYVVGEHTLIDAVSNVPPATRVTVENGEVTASRYWEPTKAGLAPEGYPVRWLDTYRLAMGDLATTSSNPSMWLSGGVDSRVAAGVLADLEYPFRTLTYSSPTGRDHELAGRVANYLDVPNRQVDRDGSVHPVDAIERAVEVTDAMINWAAVPALSFVLGDLHGAADVVIEGGSFLGDDVWAAHLQRSDSPVEAVYERKRALSAGRVRDLLEPDVDPKQSLREEVAASVGETPERRALDAVRRVYAYSHLRSNGLQRSQVGTRALAHGDVLDTVIRMPARYRMRTLPLTMGTVPAGLPPIKRSVLRRLNRNLAAIPCERTGFPPERSRVLHALGFGIQEVVSRLRGEVRTYVRRYREDDRLRSYVDGLLEAAADRSLFDADSVVELHDAFASGDADLFPTVAAITGLEQWAQRHVDTHAPTRPLPRP